ncbi:adenine-specific methyltransferase EcoRI family protein [Fibrobacter sp. UWP2]|uniref:adenine-specific methyltransferase EcoRI family protein n=1 Tax=Fibrobacter sp. UWP2 TaxID=1896216 RepID=UPI0009208589|nr:adenine-specific methyltransferase EcoRI family protein [Fibrobacter sp. UWP2]SHI60734.1 Adenine-specific methyltransferase EcoRI [Fibrobacter sp. UWP2]
MSDNRNLHSANKAKQDEFYTQLSDIENELKHYKKHFKGKTVLCNCDDPRVSNFFHYFAYNFEHLGLKRLITTCYKNQERDLFSQNNSERAIWLEYYGDKNGNLVPDPEEIGIHYFKGDGDFRSAECIELLKQADIVVTNPPFSLFTDYIGQLAKYDKKFLVLGNKNAVTYKEVFQFFKENKLWIGVTPMSREIYFDVNQDFIEESLAKNRNRTIVVRDGKYMARSPSIWFTNLDHKKRHEELILYKKYSPEEYPKYDNYDAIEVSKTECIPEDYDGIMGVPITFLDKYNPEQFEILGMESSAGYDPEIVGIPRLKDGDARPAVNGKITYARIFIRRRKEV